MRVLTAGQLRELVPMKVAVELMKQAFALYSAGETRSPLRTPVEAPDGSGVSLYMPAYVPATSSAPAASGAKVVSVYPGNSDAGLPTINAIVILLDPTTGVPEGLIEGAAMTALRTGAVSGAATDVMARADSTTLGIIGAGAQGVTQAAAVCAVRRIREIRVFDVNQTQLESFAERLSAWAPEVTATTVAARSAREVVEGADVVCTATTSSTPVFDDAWVGPGTHINAVGAFTPEMQEIPTELLLRARVVVDSVEAVLHEAGDFILPIERGELDRDAVFVELGNVVSGQLPGRESDEEVTFFKSVGNAIQDMIVAGRAVQEAKARNVGQVVDLQ